MRAYAIGSSVQWSRSYVEIPGAIDDLQAAIKRFESEQNGESLHRAQINRIKTDSVSLREATVDYFFSDRSSPGGADVTPQLESYNITDEILKVNLRNPETGKGWQSFG